MNGDGSAAPGARLRHRSAGRMRFRIPSRRGDAEYFTRVVERLMEYDGVQSVEANPCTASMLLIVRNESDPQAIDEFAREDGLFDLDAYEFGPTPVGRAVAASARETDVAVRRATFGAVDLPIFLAALFVGLAAYQISRGRLELPIWHTSLWYALNMFSKTKL